MKIISNVILALALIAVTCFALSPMARAVTPAPDGGYPGNNTAEGTGALFSRTSGINNTALGLDALYHNTSGSANTATGLQALFSNTTGIRNTADGTGALLHNNDSYNTATGWAALLNNTSGQANTADGAQALQNNTTGSVNTAVGAGALLHNNASANTAVGWGALNRNTSGLQSTAIGANALSNNTTGRINTAIGFDALLDNTTGFNNTATGSSALLNNTTGSNNTATGFNALLNNTTGFQNVANGINALKNNTTGNYNQAFGSLALGSNVDGGANVAVGDSALAGNMHGSYNTVVGDGVGPTVEGSDNTYIGANSANGVTSESDTIRIGDPNFVSACYIAGISGQTASGGAAVFIDGNGKLGTATSSARFKDNIKPMDNASESILALEPVTFRYKKEIDANRIPQFGLVAEDVAKVNPDLVILDAEGKPYTVRYEAVNAMLLNEFLKEHRKVEQQGREIQEQKATNAELRWTIAQQEKRFEAIAAHQQHAIQALTAQLNAQAAEVQKVTATLELSRSKPQLASHSQ